jgi:hypothetical protein
LSDRALPRGEIKRKRSVGDVDVSEKKRGEKRADTESHNDKDGLKELVKVLR